MLKALAPRGAGISDTLVGDVIFVMLLMLVPVLEPVTA